MILTIQRLFALFTLGGCAYTAAELLFRGRSHVSMFCAGGLGFLFIAALEQTMPALPSLLRALAGAAFITGMELVIGLTLNREYTIWDYRGNRWNFRGQICPVFSLIWIAAAWAAGCLYRFLFR